MPGTLESREAKVLSFMEQVQDDILTREQEAAFENSTDYKLKKLYECQDEGKGVCLDILLRKIYKDATPLNDDYKTACSDSLDGSFDTFIQKKCPKGLEFYIREGLKKGSPFAKKAMEAVECLVKDETKEKEFNIDDVDPKSLVFANDEDLTRKVDIIGQELNGPEISKIVHDNVKQTALSEISRAKAEKQELKKIEDELANDIKVNSPQALESALELRDIGTPKDYTPSLFEGVMINKLTDVQHKIDAGELGDTYLYGALGDFRESADEEEVRFATPEEIAFVEAVKEYTMLSVLKALKLESFTVSETRDLANEYAQAI